MMIHTSACLPPSIARTLSWQKKGTVLNFSQGLSQQIFCFQFLAMVGVERLRCLRAWWTTVARHLRAPSQRDCCQQESSHSQSFLFVSASTFLLFVVVVASPPFCLTSQFVISHSTSQVFTLWLTSLHTLALVFAFALFVELPLVWHRLTAASCFED